MKLIFLLLAAAVAADRYIEYEANKETSLWYESQTITQVPHHAEQMAGIKLQARLNMQTKQGGRTTMQLSEVRLAKVLETVEEPTLSADNLLGQNLETEFEPRIVGQYEEELTKPVEFVYMDGEVRDIRMQTNDALWSKNIKKGIMSMLQVKLSGDNPDYWQEKSVLKEEWKMERSGELMYEMNDNNDQIFKAMETDVTGICESNYNVRRDSSRSESTMLVTKSRNYRNCEFLPKFEQGIFSSLTIVPEILESRHVIEKSSDADYVIRDGQIREVRQQSRYILTPLSLEDGSTVTEVIQRLTHKQTKNIEETIVSEDNMVQCENGLLYEFPITPIDQSLKKYGSNSASFEESRENEDIMGMISSLLSAVVSGNERVSEQNVEKVQLIASLMQRLTVEEMHEMCRNEIKPNQDNKPEPTEKGEILLDLLPTLPSPKAFKVMTSLITERRISSARAIVSLNVMQFTVTPNVDMVNQMISIMSNDVLRENELLRRTVLQTLPTLISRLNRHARNVGVHERRITPFVNKFIDSFIEIFKRCEQREDTCTVTERLAMVKGMGNIAMPQMIPTLTRILQDKSKDSKVRSEAARSLAKMPMTLRPRIINILMSVYMDKTDNTMVRQSCFISAIDCKPCLSTLHLIVNTQRKETNMQVGSTVYSYFSTMIYSEMSSMRQLANNMRRVFPLIKVFAPYDITTSKVDHREIVLKNLGIAHTMEKFNHENKMMPSVLMSKIELNILGKTFPFMKQGLNINGLNGLLDNTIGISSGLRESVLGKSLKDMFKTILEPLQRHHVDLGSVAKDITDIIEKVGIVSRDHLEKLNLAYTFKLFGKDVTFVDITADDIMRWIESGNVPVIGNMKKFVSELTKSGKAFDLLKTINLAKSTHQEPTAAGLPLSVNSTFTAMLETVGDFTITRGRNANLYIKPVYQHHHYMTCGIDCGPVTTGVAIESTLSAMKVPINVKATMDMQQRKLILSNELPNDRQTVFDSEFKPKAFCTVTDNTKSIQPMKTRSIILTHSSRVQLVNATIPTPTSFNFKIIQEYVRPVSMPNWMLMPKMWAPNKCRYTLEPLSSEPSTLELDYETTTSRSKAQEMLNSEVDPIIDSQQVHACKITVKSGGRNADASKSTLTMITSSNWRKYQTKFTGESSSSPENRVESEIVTNTDSFRPSQLKEMSKSKMVNKFTWTIGSKSLKVKVFPDEPLRWNMYTQNTILNYLKQMTGEEASASIVRPVSRTPNTLNYRYEVNSDWSMMEGTYYKSAIVATTLYLKNVIPSIPLMNSRRLSSTPSQTQGQVQIIPSFQKIIATMKSTNGMEYDMSLPAYLFTPVTQLITLERPVYTSEMLPQSYPSQWHKSHGYLGLSGRCSVHHLSGENEDEVTTVDHKTYKLSDLPTNCDVVLAKDCSDYHLFTVLMKKQQAKKELTIYVKNFKILMEPVSGWTSSSVKVIANGEEIDTFNQRSSVLESIGGEVKREGEWTTVVVRKYGLSVASNGKEVVVEVAPSYQGRVCGLCGNYNSYVHDEFTGPDMYHYSDRKIWLSKYVVSSPQCTPESVRHHYGIEEISHECRPLKHTAVKDQGAETCFSMEPVNKCPSGCRRDPSQRMHKKTIPFTCRNSYDSRTRTMVEESRIRFLSELSNGPKDEERMVQEPTRCIPEY